jgi:NitT/TauT family transport system substrate-binding protein
MKLAKRLVTGAALALLAGMLAACGGGSGDSPGGGGSAIKLGFSAWPGWFPWQVAEEAGIFDKAGVNVELVWFEGYTDSINALSAGRLDANSQTLNDTLASVAAGAAQHIVLVNDNSTGNDQVIADASIKTVADLKGKRIGVEAGVVDHFLLALALQKAGMTLSDVNVVNLETGAAAASFASGQLDAVAAFAPFTSQALKRSGSHTLVTSKDFPGAIPDHLVVSGDLLRQRPADIQKLISAWFMTLEYIKANPDKALSILAKRAGVSTAEYKEYDAGTTLFTLKQNIDAFQPGNDMTHLDYAAKQVSEFMVANKFIDKPVSLAGLFEGKFVQAYAAQASR